MDEFDRRLMIMLFKYHFDLLTMSDDEYIDDIIDHEWFDNREECNELSYRVKFKSNNCVCEIDYERIYGLFQFKFLNFRSRLNLEDDSCFKVVYYVGGGFHLVTGKGCHLEFYNELADSFSEFTEKYPELSDYNEMFWLKVRNKFIQPFLEE
jgi:hypothetical protein